MPNRPDPILETQCPSTSAPNGEENQDNIPAMLSFKDHPVPDWRGKKTQNAIAHAIATSTTKKKQEITQASSH